MAQGITTNSENIFLDASYILNALQRDRDLLIHEHFFVSSSWRNTGFIKEDLRLLRTNSSRSSSNRKRTEFHIRLKNRGYLSEGLEKRISGVIFCGRRSILLDNRRAQKKIYIAFLPNPKNIEKFLKSFR